MARPVFARRASAGRPPTDTFAVRNSNRVLSHQMTVESGDNCQHDAEGRECLYVLINVAMPGLVKIGHTDRSAEARARELSAGTGIPAPYTVFRSYAVSDGAAAERRVHERLLDFRFSDDREFFSMDPETAASAIEDILQSTPRRDSGEAFGEDRLVDAMHIAHEVGFVQPSLLCKRLGVSYERAERLMNELITIGIIDSDWRIKGSPKKYKVTTTPQVSSSGAPEGGVSRKKVVETILVTLWAISVIAAGLFSDDGLTSAGVAFVIGLGFMTIWGCIRG